MLDWYLNHKDSFVELELFDNAHTKTNTPSIILAMISAYENGIPKEDIQEWKNIINDGIPSQDKYELGKSVIKTFRAKFLNTYCRSVANQEEIIKGAQLSIYYYANQIIRERLKFPKDYIFNI